MKKLMMMVLCLVGTYFAASAQSRRVAEPVKWDISKNKISETEYELLFKATIEDGYHIFTTDIPEGGPVKTSFEFEENPDIELVGKVEADRKAKRKYDKSFKMKLAWFEEGVVFNQKIKINKPEAAPLSGAVTFMVCNEKMCLPPARYRVQFEDDDIIMKYVGF